MEIVDSDVWCFCRLKYERTLSVQKCLARDRRERGTGSASGVIHDDETVHGSGNARTECRTEPGAPRHTHIWYAERYLINFTLVNILMSRSLNLITVQLQNFFLSFQSRKRNRNPQNNTLDNYMLTIRMQQIYA